MPRSGARGSQKRKGTGGRAADALGRSYVETISDVRRVDLQRVERAELLGKEIAGGDASLAVVAFHLGQNFADLGVEFGI
jgi:hypothetical protein